MNRIQLSALGREVNNGEVTVKSMTKNKSHYEDYLCSLRDPFTYNNVKVPTGYPAKTSVVSNRFILSCQLIPPVSPATQASLLINGSSYTLDVGSPVIFGFQPQIEFDDNTQLQLSFANSVTPAYALSTWYTIAPVKGWSSNFQQYRLVSSGIQYHYTGPALYRQGYWTGNTTNLANISSYSDGATSNNTSILTSDPESINCSIETPMIMTWSPADLDCLTFRIVTSGTTVSARDQDWIGYFMLNGLDYVNGCSWIMDCILNYEVVATAAFDPISGGTPSTDGSISDATEKAKEKGKDIIPGGIPERYGPGRYHPGRSVHQATAQDGLTVIDSNYTGQYGNQYYGTPGNGMYPFNPFNVMRWF